jgi:pyruvate/2-oxoglutarate dehydrogenase complex dihydrolipoamide dehydrogenase (E3) component
MAAVPRFGALPRGHRGDMAERYDAVVIGAGVAGEVCAGELADSGMRIAICERELVAGECSYWACIPSKTLLRPGEVLSEARQAPGAREAVDGGVDVGQALAWRDFMVNGWDDADQAEWLSGKDIDLHRGNARIAGPGQVEIEGTQLETERLIVASGSDPVIPPIDGLRDLEGVWTNREATGLKQIPDRLVVLGGGPVGVELGQAVFRMGSSVAIAEGDERLLPHEAAEAGEALADALEDEGIKVRLGVKASRAERRGDGFSLSFEDGSQLRGDRLLVATGRKPRVEGIGLEKIGIDPERSANGIEVDERMRAADRVWAIGDVTGIWPFTHVGKYQGRVAAADVLGRDVTADYRAVPRVVFTDPQIAAVGESEGASTGTARLSSIARTSTYTREYDQRPGFLTLVADGEKLVGARAVGPEAGEWLGQATLAIKAEIPIEVLRQTIQPYPTFSEAFFYALAEL